MSQEWMLDLLADLRGYADKSAMTELSEHLDDALIIAAREIRSVSACSTEASAHDDFARDLPRSAADHDHP